MHAQILQGNALFSGKIYTAGKILTQPPVATLMANFKSEDVPLNPKTIVQLRS